MGAADPCGDIDEAVDQWRVRLGGESAGEFPAGATHSQGTLSDAAVVDVAEFGMQSKS